MKNTLRTSLVSAALLLFAACGSTSNHASTSSVANAKCPVSGEALKADSPTTSFNGQTVGFCCNNCMTKFNAMNDADKKAKVTGAMPAK